MIRTLLVDETRLLADLKAAALRAEPDIEVVDSVCTLAEARIVCQRQACDVMVVSATLPEDGAMTLTQAVRKSHPAIKVLLTGLEDVKASIVRYLEGGVAGYVLPEEAWTACLQKIRLVAGEECPVSPAIATALLRRLQELKHIIGQCSGLQGMNPTTRYARLTKREGEVLALIEQGYSNPQIGIALCLEVGTVKNHVHNLLDKLGVPSRRQAAILARQALARQAAPLSPALGTDDWLRPAAPHRPADTDKDKHETARQRFAAGR